MNTDNTSDIINNLPWNTRSRDNLDLKRAKEILDKNHYGLTEIKERVLEYLAVLKLQGGAAAPVRAPILCLAGLAGTGKTSLAISIAEALERKFERIAFGGLGDPYFLRGKAGAEPGEIIKALSRAGTKNPVILLDEIDRADEKARATIMGVLLEILDPAQNKSFLDHFVDKPFDLSEVLFIATCNNTTNIATAVLDRLELLNMPAYTDEQKITIARDYMLPKILQQTGMGDKTITIKSEMWPKIVRPLGFDAGIRTLERNIDGMVRKVAKLIVEGRVTAITIDDSNVKEFLPQW